MVNLMNQTHQTAIIDHGKWWPNRDVLYVYIYIYYLYTYNGGFNGHRNAVLVIERKWDCTNIKSLEQVMIAGGLVILWLKQCQVQWHWE